MTTTAKTMSQMVIPTMKTKINSSTKLLCVLFFSLFLTACGAGGEMKSSQVNRCLPVTRPSW